MSQIGRRTAGLRPFQLCALSRDEMRAALDHARSHDHPLVTIVSHSFELASRDGRRVNRPGPPAVRATLRLPRTRIAATMPTVRFADLPRLPGPVRDRSRCRRGGCAPPTGSRSRRWGNVRYERPQLGHGHARADAGRRWWRDISIMPASETALPLRIGARTLWTLRRRLVRRRLTLEEALAGEPAAAVARSGRSGLSGEFASGLARGASAGTIGLAPFIRQRYVRSFTRLDTQLAMPRRATCGATGSTTYCSSVRSWVGRAGGHDEVLRGSRSGRRGKSWAPIPSSGAW